MQDTPRPDHCSLQVSHVTSDSLIPLTLTAHSLTHSAGIGRTGVFMMIELGIAHFQAKVSLVMPAILNKLRTQRMGLVQTEVRKQNITRALY